MATIPTALRRPTPHRPFPGAAALSAAAALLALAPAPIPAAAASRPAAPGDQAEPVPAVAPVYSWLAILPAPRHAVAEAGGAREASPLSGTITQPYGCTEFALETPAQGCPGGFHTGLDIAAVQGTPIRAAGAGLAYAFQDDQRYGNHVLVQEAGGYSTLYAHMVRTGVGWGQPVRAGDVIGWVGSTGNSTGPHLHFEVRFAGLPQDPGPYLEGRPGVPFPVPAGWPGAPRDDQRGRR